MPLNYYLSANSWRRPDNTHLLYASTNQQRFYI